MKFAEHFNQATLFYNSQTPWEQAHIAAAFRFELSKVMVPAIRARVVSMLLNVSEDLASKVANGLGMEMPEPMPRAIHDVPEAEVDGSPSLSLTARPGDGTVRTRKVAIVVGEGTSSKQVEAFQKALLAQGAVGRLVGPRVGPFAGDDGETIDADGSFENEPGILFDGLVIPDCSLVDDLAGDGRLLEHIKDQYRHSKTLMAIGNATALFETCGLNEPDNGLLFVEAFERGTPSAFIEALAEHRHPERETDPPRV
jgi:catalase